MTPKLEVSLSTAAVIPPGSAVAGVHGSASIAASRQAAGATKRGASSARRPPRRPPSPPNLRADRRNAWAFAPLACPHRVTVEGRVSAEPAWSTSKVLVAAAFVQTLGEGEPKRLTTRQRRWVTAALRRSDMASLLAMSAAIPAPSLPRLNKVGLRVLPRNVVIKS